MNEFVLLPDCCTYYLSTWLAILLDPCVASDHMGSNTNDTLSEMPPIIIQATTAPHTPVSCDHITLLFSS